MYTLPKLGIIGGGQLGKMMILAAKEMGISVVILDPTRECPAHSIADEHIVAGFDDEAGFRELATKVDVVTYEFEHITVSLLEALELSGSRMHPSAGVLKHIQDKYTQKTYLSDHGFPVPQLLPVSSLDEATNAAQALGYPFLLKSRRGGYDGKGNTMIREKADLLAFFKQDDGKNPQQNTEQYFAEAYVPFEREISVLVCRGQDGKSVVYPLAENLHHENILLQTQLPATISPTLAKQAIELSQAIAELYGVVGMLCVELFATADEQLLVNELAPRPHNSGHATIEGCVTSQFANHIRSVTGLPLGETTLIRPAIMLNLLGKGNGTPHIHGLHEALGIPGVSIHLYGKTMIKPSRKMGHVTITAETLENAQKHAAEVKNLLWVSGQNYFP